MLRGIEDRVFLVTGAAGGLGTAAAAMLVKRGGKVVVTDVDAEQGIALVKRLDGVRSGRARFEQLDVADPVVVDALADRLWDEEWGVHGVFANAGIAPSSPAAEYSDELWRRTMGINLDGVFFTVRAFARRLLERNLPGAFVITSSIAGFSVVTPETHAAYGASKAAVAHLASLLGVEWARNGIRVNAVAPGYTATPILDRLKAEAPDVFEHWLARTPAGRLNTPDEIAESVLFLFSENASGITGTTLHVDNGYSAR